MKTLEIAKHDDCGKRSWRLQLFARYIFKKILIKYNKNAQYKNVDIDYFC